MKNNFFLVVPQLHSLFTGISCYNENNHNRGEMEEDKGFETQSTSMGYFVASLVNQRDDPCIKADWGCTNLKDNRSIFNRILDTFLRGQITICLGMAASWWTLSRRFMHGSQCLLQSWDSQRLYVTFRTQLPSSYFKSDLLIPHRWAEYLYREKVEASQITRRSWKTGQERRFLFREGFLVISWYVNV